MTSDRNKFSFTIYSILIFLISFCVLLMTLFFVLKWNYDFINYSNYLTDDVPVILWWTPFTIETGEIRECSSSHRCLFTNNHSYLNHDFLRIIAIYGTRFNVFNLSSMPARSNRLAWALLHEESPKNNLALTGRPTLFNLFNTTATFSRFSSFPLTTQYLPDLASIVDTSTWYIDTKKKEEIRNRLDLASVLYVHSDCDTPSQRDEFVKELMKHIRIDSYGLCLHNRDLPKGLDKLEAFEDDEFYHLVAQYKFTLAFENAICDDYITEKLWRPLRVGSLPIYRGSSNVTDWLPNPNSAIIVGADETPEQLAKRLIHLDLNRDAYESMLKHKLAPPGVPRVTNPRLLSTMSDRNWGSWSKPHFDLVPAFECFLCEQIWNGFQKASGSENQYVCDLPQNNWIYSWRYGNCEAQAALERLNSGNKQVYDESQINDIVVKLIEKGRC